MSKVVCGKEIPLLADSVTTLEYYSSYVTRIQNEIAEIQKTFISLGFHLHEMQSSNMFMNLGYENFYNFCQDNFHLSRSSVQRYITVWYKFCHNEGGRKIWIDERYKEFEYSQLVEMLNMPHPEVVTSDMTIKQIRELKKKQKNAAKGINNHSELSEEKKENNKKCPVRSSRGFCGYCYYLDNEGCLYPDQKDVFALPARALSAPSDHPDQEVVSGEVCDVAQPEEQSPEEEFNIDCLARLDLPDGSVCLSTPCLPEQVKQAISNYVGYLESNSFAMTDLKYIQHLESIIDFLLKL